MKTIVRLSSGAMAALLYITTIALDAAEQSSQSGAAEATGTSGRVAPASAELRSVFEAGETTSSGDEAQGSEKRFFILGRGSRSFSQMSERLKDPQQRAALRAEQRASLQAMHVDLGRVVGIDAATEENLIDLLTDQQLSQLDAFHGDGGPMAGPDVLLKTRADAMNRNLDAQRELLGEEGLERFQAYTATLPDRSQANTFDARLAPADKLQPEQKDQLIALFQEDMQRKRRDMQRMIGRSRSSFFPQSTLALETLPSEEEMRRRGQLSTIAANEDSLRSMPQSHRWFAERAAQFLTQPQVVALKRMHTEREGELRKWIEQARVQAGLHPTIPDHPDVESDTSQPPRTPIAGSVKLEMIIKVDQKEPARLSHVGANGETVTFELADDLLVDATPTLYDDDWLDVQMTYYERDGDGKRQLGSGGGFGRMMRTGDGSPDMQFGTGGGHTILAGKRAYVISTEATAAPL